MADRVYKSKSKRTSFWIRVFFLVSIFFSSKSLAQEKIVPLTNEVFLRQTIKDVLEDCLKDAPIDSQMVWVKEEGENQSAWIVKEEIVSFLSKRGPVGVGKKEGQESFSPLLSYRIIKLNLEYPEIKRKKLFGKSWITRESQVAISFSLSDPDGKILWSKRGERKNSDLLRKEELLSLNNRQYPFLCPEIPESTWGKYIEPAVVTVVVGGLIYLFFANR
ncbi:MAG: hypothetical protein MUP17_08220 [candidate division Zixibacteria bacterium]|nr:hypothetical protein [candidate division Zixibacteria bacterium]